MIVPSDVQQRIQEIQDRCVLSLRKVLQSLPREGPALAVESRIKSISSVEHKLARYAAHKKSGPPVINDYLGIRVIIPHQGLVERTVAEVKNWVGESDLFSLCSEFDYFSMPSQGMYRAVHIDLNFKEDTLQGDCFSIGTEIQIITYLQYCRTTISHQIGYHAGIFKPPNALLHILLTTISDDLTNIDKKIAAMFASLQASDDGDVGSS